MNKKDNEAHDVVIVIPVYRSRLSPTERFSLRQAMLVLDSYDICFVCPQGLKLPGECPESYLREDFDPAYFQSTEDYNALMLSDIFYKRFDRYEFMLVYQLDAFIFRDDLESFCGMDYDFIGAPFFWGNEFREVDGNRFTALVGNGGFSLRRIKPFCSICEKQSDFIQKNIYKNEDILFAYLGSLGELRIAPEAVALSFSNELLDEEVIRDYQSVEPMGCHGWAGFYRERYLQKFRDLGLDCSEIESLMTSKEDKYKKIWFSELQRRYGNGKDLSSDALYEVYRTLRYMDPDKLPDMDRFTDEPATLSVCMIVRNEEEVLEECLQEVSRFADEIVIVDTGSTDSTKEIAGRFTDKVYDFEWCDDFAAARNASYSYATCEYIMWLDADDRISDPDIHRILEFKVSVTMEPKSKGILFMADYERPENGGVFRYPRIVRRDAHIFWEGRVHEHQVTGELTGEQCQNACFRILHAKKGEPNYQRNIAIMDKVPQEDLHRSFWLCAQCYLDCVLAGESKKAEQYLLMAEESGTSFEKRLSTYNLINSVLKYRKFMGEMIRWNAMYMRVKKKYRRVSIIIPIYNAEKHIARCLDSILMQEQASYEVICVDDGFTDSTGDILSSYQEKMPDLKVISYGCNRGQAYARNRGLETSVGKYVYFLDADDKLTDPLALYKLCSLADEQALDCVTFGSRALLYDSGDEMNLEGHGQRSDLLERHTDYNGVFQGEEYLGKLFLNGDFKPAVWMQFWDRDFLCENDLSFDENSSPCEDALFTIQAFCKAGRIRYLDEKLHEYGYSKDSSTEKASVRLLHANIVLYIRVIEYCIGEGITHKTEKILMEYSNILKERIQGEARELGITDLSDLDFTSEADRILAGDLLWPEAADKSLLDKRNAGMKTISVCMIVRDEEEVLEECLRNVMRFADELVIVDTGSKDNTKEIARRFTDKVYDLEWCDDFSRARNMSFSYATGDYVMPVDADRIIDDNEAKKLIVLKKSLGSYNTVCGIYDSPDNMGVNVSTHICMKRGDGRCWQGAVHERYKVEGPVLYSSIRIRHLDKKKRGENPEVNGRTFSNYAKKLSPQEFKENFWLGIQCSLDYILAGDITEAKRLIAMALEQNPPAEELLRNCLLAGNFLLYWEHYKEALGMYELYISEMAKRGIKNRLPKSPDFLMLLQKAAKCAEKIGDSDKAFELIEMALVFFPDCMSAKLNRMRYLRQRKTDTL